MNIAPMHIAIVGAGIAGLGAALRLRDLGHQVTIFDRNTDAGGRCRSVHWQGGWRITGAFAFISSETNLIDQARALGIYDTLPRVELTETHEQTLLYKREKLIRQRSFSVTDILRNDAIPLKEKAALGLAFPRLFAQFKRNDPRDLTTAVALDDDLACDWFRKHSPAFVDYYLEPTMQMFCGYGPEDFSLGWLAWLMSGLEWSNGWWSFADRGVGMLTHRMELALSNDPGARLALATDVRQVTETPGGIDIASECGGVLSQHRFDKVVMAVPGTMVPILMPGLDAPRRAFFDQVSYVGHHIMNMVVKPGDFPIPSKTLLPTADGFSIISNLVFNPRADGLWDVYAEMKGRFCADHAGASSAKILDLAWDEAIASNPKLATLDIIDRRLQRNDIAIARRPAGYIRALKAFTDLPPNPRIAFAGDYLLNSTVGQSHWTGLRAADQLHAG